MRRATIQAGLFGGGVAIFLGLLTLLPYVGLCLALPLYPLAFFLTGLVTVRISDQSPDVGEASISGAIAGTLAGIIGGLAAMFLAPIRLNISGGPEDLIALLTPERTQALIDRGINPIALMDFVGGVGFGMFCCATQLITGIMLAALGAALYAAYRRT